MTELSIESLGFTQEELRERVIERMVETLLRPSSMDEDGYSYPSESEFKSRLDASIEDQINATVAALAEEHVLPNVSAYIEHLTLTETNQWGEKKGRTLTFTEYLVSRAEAYMQEKVDWNGKSKQEERSSIWNGKQTRLTFLVHQHLHHEIEQAMKGALKTVLDSTSGALAETVKMKLDEVAKALKVSVTTR